MAHGQDSATQHVAVPTMPARPEDVATIDGVIKAYYDVISGPPGQPRQWSRDRTLYWPGLRFFSAGAKPDGTPTVDVLTHQQYVDMTNAGYVKRGFDEHEIHRVTNRIGNIAHVMSTYDTRRTPGGPLLARGVNSIDLYWDGTRWWITAASWDDERPGSPIPPELLGESLGNFPDSMRDDVANVAKAFAQYPGDPCVLYEVAALQARAGHVQQALQAIRAMMATGAGLDPRERDGFASLRDNADYQALKAEIRRQNPPVLNARKAFEIAEGDLVPEGVAYSTTTHQMYLGSIKRKIIAVSPDGVARDFVKPATGGLNSVVGIRVDDARGELWATSDAIGAKPPDAVIGLLRFRLSDGTLIKRYPIDPSVADLLNDLTVAPDGFVYVTATHSGTVIRLDPRSGEVKRIAGDLPGPNGITVTPDGKYLFVAGDYTITRIELASGATHVLDKSNAIADGCFDGLYWEKDRSLVGIQNCVHATGRVMRLTLTPDLDGIVSATVLESYNPVFDRITTAAIAGHDLLFVANTQFNKVKNDGTLIEPFNPLVVLRLDLTAP
jgi:sugar lactone lactonase YvrE